MRFLSILLFVIHDIVFLPVSDPIIYQKDLHLLFFGRANDAFEARIDNHFFAYEAREGVDGLIFSWNTAVQIHVTTEKADTGAGCVDDGVLLGMDTPTEFIALSMGYV